ncbi:L-rhamnose mutarotase [Streptomyces sp. NPDC002928]|uniref:L-rhamnose mutarotase n=1 Tax=Streptomyces sp. NPDC002928 TaxID=3154440 RepID=UPI0033AD4F0F
MRVALHARVRADRVAAYEAAHREVPKELADAIRAAGATSWTIWRWGSPRASGAERGGGADLATWQARMAELLDVPHDYSREGADAGLPVIGELP